MRAYLPAAGVLAVALIVLTMQQTADDADDAPFVMTDCCLVDCSI
jgi:hypothetical protein